MTKKLLSGLSKSALVTVLASSTMIPTVAAEEPVVKRIESIFFEHENLPYEISLSDYRLALAVGVIFDARIKYISHNDNVYLLTDYREAFAVGKTTPKALELLEGNPALIQHINPGTIEIKDKKPQYIPPKFDENDLQITEVSSIDKTGVTVTFPSLVEGMTDQKITVIDPDDTEVAVKAQDLATGVTEATFEFVTELDELTPGTWTINGKEFVVEENTTKENETKRYLAS